jgi:hypothetical protein
MLRRLVSTSFVSFILRSDSTFELSIAFKNILLCCRLLPPDMHTHIYNNLPYYLEYGKHMATIYRQDWPETDELVSFLFDFDRAPFSYSHLAKTEKDHFSAFIEILWDEICVILVALHSSGLTEDQLIAKLKYVWLGVKRPKFKGECWKDIAARIAKGKDWIPEYGWSVIDSLSRGLELTDECMDLHLFLEAVLACRNNRFQRMKKFSDAFRDKSKDGKKTQCLVSKVFEGIKDKGWTHEMIILA